MKCPSGARNVFCEDDGMKSDSNTATNAVTLQRSNKITLFTSYLYISHTVL